MIDPQTVITRLRGANFTTREIDEILRALKGKTLRDEIAIAVLPIFRGDLAFETLAQWAYGMADAMMEARDK